MNLQAHLVRLLSKSNFEKVEIATKKKFLINFLYVILILCKKKKRCYKITYNTFFLSNN